VILPSRTSEIVPSSSETTITMASVSSVRPIAARWRVPSVFDTFGFVVSGRKQPAAVMRPFWMMSAPSWIGDSGRKMLVTSSRDTRASRRVPTSIHSFSPTSFWSTMSAPMRRPARCATARTSSSTDCPCAMRSRGEKSGPVPTCVSSRPDVVLEDDQEEDERPRQQVVQQDVDGVDLEHSREEVETVHHAEPDQDRDGARAADELDQRVDADREQEDVDAVLPSEGVEQLFHALSPPIRPAPVAAPPP
jgi:hypothetical protein